MAGGLLYPTLVLAADAWTLADIAQRWHRARRDAVGQNDSPPPTRRGG
ncbi:MULTISPECIES: hypothetical protein [Streptomyces]|uniref:Uncharacterized protein n=1 Tax=Streptomyces mordarskii TaxID=1226758 RepID=A0ABN1DXK1_9ACTN